MLERPYTLLSCALSLDGYLGSATPRRLELSNDADFDRVDAVRASCDAILVGAATVRHDNPRLLVRSEARRAERTARGLAPSPIKVTVTERVELDACADFFAAGDTEKLVYCATARVADARSRAPRFVSDGRFPWNPDRRATLAEVRQIGDVVLLRYALSPRFGVD